MSSLADFHFLRPIWLLALLPALLLLWLHWRSRAEVAWRRVIAPHLLPHLLSGSGEKESWPTPVHLLAAFWLAGAIALAGPSWQREMAPFADQRSALVIALHLGPSMLAEDIQPSRLERATHKIRDLLALRSGARTALIAYAGSAHMVVPFTTDSRLIEDFAGELSPELMPRPGNDAGQAVALAARLLQQAELTGNVLLITDAITPDALPALPPGAGAAILAMAAPSGAPPPASGPPAPALDRQTMQAAASALDGRLVEVSVDDRDISALARHFDRQHTGATAEEDERWRDAGYYLLFPLVLIVLLWFRRGWALRWRT